MQIHTRIIGSTSAILNSAISSAAFVSRFRSKRLRRFNFSSELLWHRSAADRGRLMSVSLDTAHPANYEPHSAVTSVLSLRFTDGQLAKHDEIDRHSGSDRVGPVINPF